MKRFLLSLTVLFTALTAAAGPNSPGAVYTATNAKTGNEILVFDRAADGSLTFSNTISTGGLGSGDSLGNASAIALSQDHSFLFVVNAGSNDISSFAVGPTGLTLASRVPSGGQRPISLTTFGSLLFVLNAGGQAGTTDNIAGFSIAGDGTLTPIAGSTRPLSGSDVGPAQIAFNGDGTILAVTEKNTSWIDTYVVNQFGVAHGPKVFASAGATPFGFAFGKRNQIVVSEAPGSAASSYSISFSGDLHLISASVADTQAAACWIAVTNDGRYAYAANAGSSSISGYAIAPDGTLTLLDSDGQSGLTAKHPVDEAISANGRYLYVLDDQANAISIFEIRADGSLQKQADAAVNASTNGLAVR
ncbi:MAG TPA: beta-propeller fold lactonase family protein [Thermoanaerobaculia bacterium]|nr:beta-propeller fold lactonase family protein [Thermoanaerobaculia bacterium]